MAFRGAFCAISTEQLSLANGPAKHCDPQAITRAIRAGWEKNGMLQEGVVAVRMNVKSGVRQRDFHRQIRILCIRFCLGLFEGVILTLGSGEISRSNMSSPIDIDYAAPAKDACRGEDE